MKTKLFRAAMIAAVALMSTVATVESLGAQGKPPVGQDSGCIVCGTFEGTGPDRCYGGQSSGASACFCPTIFDCAIV